MPIRAGQRISQLDYLVVLERTSQFQSDRHARPVDLGVEIAGKVFPGVYPHGPGLGGSASGFALRGKFLIEVIPQVAGGQELLQLVRPHPVSLELTEVTEKKMIAQAREIASWGDNVVIKVPVGGYQALDPAYDPFTGLKVIRALWEKDIKTNATLVFNSTQAFWAAQAGATFVSPFLGRLADYAYKHDHPERPGGNSLYWVEDHKDTHADQNVFNTEYVASGGARKDIGVRLIQEISAIFTNYDIHTEILAASVRNFAQLSELLLAGADILTVPAHIPVSYTHLTLPTN